jgi:hypothetical protein
MIGPSLSGWSFFQLPDHDAEPAERGANGHDVAVEAQQQQRFRTYE